MKAREEVKLVSLQQHVNKFLFLICFRTRAFTAYIIIPAISITGLAACALLFKIKL